VRSSDAVIFIVDPETTRIPEEWSVKRMFPKKKKRD